MKKKIDYIICAIIGIVFLAPVVCDGMMNWFGLSQATQYAYNFVAIVFGIPILVAMSGAAKDISK